MKTTEELRGGDPGTVMLFGVWDLVAPPRHIAGLWARELTGPVGRMALDGIFLDLRDMPGLHQR